MKKIKLTNRKYALVDDEDFVWLDKLKWYCGGRYAKRGNPSVYMHRLIMRAKKGIEVDHKNGNGLDNRKSNLRLCSQTENTRNSKISKRNSSGFKGVRLHKKNGKWRASIMANSKPISLGYFNTKEQAALAYAEASKKYHLEFSRLA